MSTALTEKQEKLTRKRRDHADWRLVDLGTFKDVGIVIAERPSGESGKTVIVLTKDNGKLFLTARGAKNPKSKLTAGTQQFAFCEFVIFEGNGFMSVSQVEVRESFYNLSTDLERLCIANYFAEVIERSVMPGMPTEDILRLLLKALRVLNNVGMKPRAVLVVFRLKYMQLAGFEPETGSCSICGTEMGVQELFFSKNGVCCRNCLQSAGGYAKISNGAKLVISYILENELRNVFNFRISDEIQTEIEAATRLFVDINLEMKFHSLEIL